MRKDNSILFCSHRSTQAQPAHADSFWKPLPTFPTNQDSDPGGNDDYVVYVVPSNRDHRSTPTSALAPGGVKDDLIYKLLTSTLFGVVAFS